MKTNPKKHASAKPRSPAQRAATARMLAANRARRGGKLKRNPMTETTYRYRLIEGTSNGPKSKTGTIKAKSLHNAAEYLLPGAMFSRGNGTAQNPALYFRHTGEYSTDLYLTEEYSVNPARTRTQRAARKRKNTKAGYYPNPRATTVRSRRVVKRVHTSGKYKVQIRIPGKLLTFGTVATFVDKAKATEYARALHRKHNRAVRIIT